MANITRQRVANASLLEYASKNREEGFFSDVTIVAGNENISANRLVLSCYSRYFEGMFKSRMKERYENTIEIQAIDGETTKALIDFIYTGSVTISNDNVMSLLSGADYLQLHDVKQFCFEFLQSNITPDNSLSIMKAAALYKSDTLKKVAQQCISSNFEEVAESDDFLTSTKQELVSTILQLNKDQVTAESIYDAIITWTRHDQLRAKEFLDLFKMLDLNDITINFLEETILEEDLVISSFECQKLAMKAFRNIMTKEKSKHSKSKLVSLGGRDDGKRKVAVVYNLFNSASRNFSDLPENRYGHSTLLLQNFIYSIGGKNESDDNSQQKASDIVWKLNTLQQNAIWEEVASMNEKRFLMGAAVYYDTLVVVGGANRKGHQLASSEFYQTALNKWKYIATLNQRRSGLAAVASGGYFYALGGWNEDDKHLSSVERLSDLTATSWENVESMQTTRRWLAAVNCVGEIYAIGGQAGDGNETRLKTVEKYDAATNQWKYVSDMNFARCVHTASVLQDKIYVVGGRDEKSQVVKEIECYDPATNTWKIVGSTDDELFHHSVVALTDSCSLLHSK